MSMMTDPSAGLPSFQDAVSRGSIELERAVRYPNLFIHVDIPDGRTRRLTFARIEEDTVTTLVQFAKAEPYNGLACFAIGYAVVEAYRNRRRATETVTQAVSEFWHGMRSSGTPKFYVEALIDVENKASQRVAERTISNAPLDVIDKLSGRQALQYIDLIQESKFY